jgi:hypothetical protein
LKGPHPRATLEDPDKLGQRHESIGSFLILGKKESGERSQFLHHLSLTLRSKGFRGKCQRQILGMVVKMEGKLQDLFRATL